MSINHEIQEMLYIIRLCKQSKKQLPKCTEPSKTTCSGSMVYQIKNECEKQKRPANEISHLRDVSAILCFLILFNMLLSLCDDCPYMTICKRVEHRFSFSSAFYQLILLQNAKLVGIADCVMCSASARSQTHTSASNRTNRIWIRVESPNTLKSSARS